MSDGLNEEFMNDPDAFLQKYSIDIAPYLNMEGKMGGSLNDLGRGTDQSEHVPAGVHDFDLALDAKNMAQLRLFNDRQKQPTRYSKRIAAYWLPWNPRGAASISLDDLNNSGAAYLFTSSLAGCRFLITEDGCHHISGSINQAEREDVTEQLRQGGRARAFSATTGTAYGDGAFICGYRNRTGFARHRAGGWNFVAQASDCDVGGYSVRQVWMNNDLFLIE